MPGSRWCSSTRDVEAAEKGKAYAHKLMTDQVMKGRAKTADRDALLSRIARVRRLCRLAGLRSRHRGGVRGPEVKAEVIERAEAAIGADCIVALEHLDLADRRARGRRRRARTNVHRHPLLLARREDDARRDHPRQEDRRARARRRPRLRAGDQEDADRRQRRARLLRQPLRRRLHPRGPSDADRGRAAGDDRERRQAGRHAGRASLAQRRGRHRPGAQDRQGDEGAGRSACRASGAGAASRRHGGTRGPSRPQEPQGLLRLSGERAQAPLARARRPAVEAPRCRTRSISRS